MGSGIPSVQRGTKDLYRYFKLEVMQEPNTVQLTGNVTGTRTTRQASTRETREGTGAFEELRVKPKQLES